MGQPNNKDLQVPVSCPTYSADEVVQLFAVSNFVPNSHTVFL